MEPSCWRWSTPSSAAVSLRGLEAGWNANRQHHYHLGSAPLVGSTVSDASRRRPIAIVAETFSLMASELDRQTRRDGAASVKLIDATPIPLGKLCDWALSDCRRHRRPLQGQMADRAYKARWQIEPFRWIKQHLRIRRFLGNNDNAIRLQIFAAMIA